MFEDGKDIDNCWDFFNCKEKVKMKCPAFRVDSGNECWFVASTFPAPNKKKFTCCVKCPWFKKLNTKNEGNN